jgi:transcriptional regulator with XRE-family HTH domain
MHKQRCLPFTDDESMHIGKRLKLLMQAKGITTEAMAAVCGVTPGAVSNWFSTGHITRDNLICAADALGESVRYLITGDDHDRALSEIEAEFARREVSDGTLESILTLIRSSPKRAPPAPAASPDADAEHYRKAIQPHKKPGKQDAGRGRKEK